MAVQEALSFLIERTSLDIYRNNRNQKEEQSSVASSNDVAATRNLPEKDEERIRREKDGEDEKEEDLPRVGRYENK